MAHLTQTELINIADAFYATIFGDKLMKKWKDIKLLHGFMSEKDFVEWMLNLVEPVKPVEHLLLDTHNSNSVKLERTSIDQNGYNFAKYYDVDDLSDEVSISYASDNNADAEQQDDGIEVVNDDVSVMTCGRVKHKKSRGTYNLSNKEDNAKRLKLSNANNNCDSVIVNDCAKFSCDICSMEFDDEATVLQHQVSAHQSTSADISSSQLAVSSEQQGSIYTCSVCGQVLNTRTERINHEKTEHAEELQLLTCEWCSKKFANRHSRDFHIRSIHLRSTRVSCEMCGKTFCNASKLRRHNEEVHMQLKRFECHMCDKKFAREEKLISHHALAHASSDGGDMCEGVTVVLDDTVDRHDDMWTL